jgi:hypothetical protein
VSSTILVPISQPTRCKNFRLQPCCLEEKSIKYQFFLYCKRLGLALLVQLLVYDLYYHEIVFRFLQKQENILSSRMSASYARGNRTLSPCVQWTEHKVNHPPLSGTRLRISETIPPFLHMLSRFTQAPFYLLTLKLFSQLCWNSNFIIIFFIFVKDL